MTVDQIQQLRAELSRTYRERDKALARNAVLEDIGRRVLALMDKMWATDGYDWDNDEAADIADALEAVLPPEK